MIDYLERIFTPGQVDQTGEAGEPLPAVRLDGEQPVPMVRAPLLSEQPQWVAPGSLPGDAPVFRPVARGEWEQPGQMKGAELSWEEPEQGAWERTALSRAEQQQTQQGLERRLRRESRRYDGPFYRY